MDFTGNSQFAAVLYNIIHIMLNCWQVPDKRPTFRPQTMLAEMLHRKPNIGLG